MSSNPGGQPSTTQPMAGPCDSPKEVTVNRVPRVLPDIRDSPLIMRDLTRWCREGDPLGVPESGALSFIYNMLLHFGARMDVTPKRDTKGQGVKA